MSDFQRRHYQAIAAIVANCRPQSNVGINPAIADGATIACDEMAESLAYYFAADNPLFDRDRFAAACRGEHYKGKRRVA